MTIFKERIQPTFTTAGVNALIVEQLEETFYDIYEIVINGNKYIAEKIGEYNNAPIVKVPIIYNGNREEKPFVLYKGDPEILFNPEISEIRSSYIQEAEEQSTPTVIVSNIVEQCKQYASNYEEVVRVDESVSDYVNDNVATIYDELNRTKQTLLDEFVTISDRLSKQTDNQIVEQFATVYNKLKCKLEENAEKFQQYINAETKEVYESLRSELYNKIENIFRTQISANILKEFKKQRVELDKTQVEINNALKDGLKVVTEQADTHIANILQEQNIKLNATIKATSDSINEKLDLEIAKVITKQDNNTKILVEECKNLLLSQIKADIANVQLSIQQIITEKKSNNSQLDVTKIQKQLEKNIEDRFNSELTNIKRYVSLSSGGGSGSARASGGGSGDVFWGDIGGDITSQTDLSSALDQIRSDITSLQQSITGISPTSSNGSLTIDIGDGVNIIRENTFCYLIMPYSCTLNSWRIIADTSGILTIDVKKSNYTLFPSTTSIVNSNYISLSNQQTNTSVITGWTTTSLLSTDVIHCVVNTASGIRKATISINLTK